MKLIQVNPRADNERSIFSALNEKERELRRGVTSFSKRGKNKWQHVKFGGWITLTNAPENILFAKVKTRDPYTEGRLAESFIGYLTRHCSDLIYSMTIYYL